jgi:hypothetical protein
MAGVTEWTADAFWAHLQWVARQGREQKARLEAQRLDLQHSYTAARNSRDDEKMEALKPLIHQNSTMRVRWNELRDQFNDLSERARSFLAEHGITESPALAGMGLLPAVVVPALWVAALIAVVAIVHEIDAGIRAVSDALQRLGPLGATALSFVPLALILAAIFLVPRFVKRVV